MTSASGNPILVWQVALPIPLPRLFDYLPVPGAFEPMRGARLRVPFGNRVLIGFFIAAAQAEVDATILRAAEAVLDQQPLFDDELWHSLTWAARYYQRALGEVLTLALPAPLRQGEALPDTRIPHWF